MGPRLREAADCAKLLDEVRIKRERLDAHPDLLNVANGTLDLRSFDLRPHAPADLLTQTIDVPYEPNTQAPRWGRFLEEVFLENREVIAYVQRAVGYSLTGGIGEQCFFLLHGAGANGKSTFMAPIVHLLGEYAVKVGQEALLTAEKNKGRGATPELMVLRGRRLAYVDEMEEGRVLDEARIKALTGSPKETGRELYQGMAEWRNTAKLWFDLNHLPAFKGIDEGIARRPRVIPFDRRFDEGEQDKALAATLLTELPGILAWAVDGCRQWRTHGLNPPDAVSLATREYVDEQNHLPVFFAENYAKDPRARVGVADLRATYERWCQGQGELPMSKAKVNAYFKTVQKLRQETHGQSGRVWLGVRRTGPDGVSVNPPSTHSLEEFTKSPSGPVRTPPLDPFLAERVRPVRERAQRAPRR